MCIQVSDYNRSIDILLLIQLPLMFNSKHKNG